MSLLCIAKDHVNLAFGLCLETQWSEESEGFAGLEKPFLPSDAEQVSCDVYIHEVCVCNMSKCQTPVHSSALNNDLG